MVVYDKTYALGANEGSPARTSNQYIVLHDTGNANNVGTNSAINEASYMQRNWQSAYTHAIAGWDKVYIIGEPGYVAYGAGSPANERSPFQIELARYADHAKAIAAYKNWVAAAVEHAKKYGIPLTLDAPGKGIKSHKWVSDNLWGDHQDPYGYLSSIGITKAQVAADLAGETKDGDDEMSFSVKVPVDRVGGALITKTDGAKIYADASLTKASGKKVNRGSQWVVVAIKDGALNLGGSQWIDGRDAVVKLNPIASNPHAVGVAVVTSKDLWTQAKPGKGQAGIKHLPQGSKWKVAKLTDGYLSAGTGQWIDVSKVKIEL